MNESNPNPNATRDFFGGLVLVPLLHIVFAIAWGLVCYLTILTVPFFNKDYNFIMLGFPMFFLSISQITYLIPTYIYFAKKQRQEVCKGIICSAIITVFINGACFVQMGAGGGVLIPGIVGAIALAIAIGFIGKAILDRNMR